MRKITLAVAPSAFIVTAALAWVAFGPSAGASEGLSASDSSSAARFNTVDEMSAEYSAALREPDLQMPPAVVVPQVETLVANRASTAAVDGNPLFEKGFGEVRAAEVYRCAWQTELLNAIARGDESSKGEAIARLQAWYEIEAVVESVQDPGQLWYADVVVPATTGDVKNLEDDLRFNCDPSVSVQAGVR